MGCAGSTPMIATAGSEMLKSASHVAADATKTAEGAVQEVTHSLEKTIDTVKENVSTTVTGMTNDLSNAIKGQTHALDEAKNNLLGKLNINAIEEDATNTTTMANKIVEVENVKGTVENLTAATAPPAEADNEEDEDNMKALARAPTPPLNDADSLRTSSPEPEIEQAFANIDPNDSGPPTPQPSIAELAHLSEALKHSLATAATTATAIIQDTGGEVTANKNVKEEDVTKSKKETVANDADTIPVENTISEEPTTRPNTTEWEKYADTLAHLRKYNPHDAFRRGGKLRSFGASYNIINQMATSISNNRLYNHNFDDDESGISDPYYNSLSSPPAALRSSLLFHSNRSSARGLRRRGIVPRGIPAPNPIKTNSSLLARRLGTTATTASTTANGGGRQFDYNPNRWRVSNASQDDRQVTRSLACSPIPTKRYINTRTTIRPTRVNSSLNLRQLPITTRKPSAIHSRPVSPPTRFRATRSITNVVPLRRAGRRRGTTLPAVVTSTIHQSRINSPILQIISPPKIPKQRLPLQAARINNSAIDISRPSRSLMNSSKMKPSQINSPHQNAPPRKNLLPRSKSTLAANSTTHHPPPSATLMHTSVKNMVPRSKSTLAANVKTHHSPPSATLVHTPVKNMLPRSKSTLAANSTTHHPPPSATLVHTPVKYMVPQSKSTGAANSTSQHPSPVNSPQKDIAANIELVPVESTTTPSVATSKPTSPTRSSRSSTSASIVIKSNFTTPQSLSPSHSIISQNENHQKPPQNSINSPSRNSRSNDRASSGNIRALQKNTSIINLENSAFKPIHSQSRRHGNDTNETGNYIPPAPPSQPPSLHLAKRQSNFQSQSPAIICYCVDTETATETATDASQCIKTTPTKVSKHSTSSSLLNSPRRHTSMNTTHNSPYSRMRKSYGIEYENDKENETVAPAFVADLSSVHESRLLRTPSPYKLRDRCSVCYNKYVIK